MTKKSDLPPAPSHLRPETVLWWAGIVGEYDLEVADLRVLEAACIHWDRAAAARVAITESETGLLIQDRFGCPREHPAISIEQNATRLFLAALRQLGLGLEPSPDALRLPGPTAPRERED